MQIKEIQPEMAGINITARVLKKEPPRTVRSKKGGMLRVAEVLLGDASGRIILTLWQKQIYLVKIGDVVEIENGYANAFQGITRLTLGRNGTLKVIEAPDFPSMHDLLKDLREDLEA